ncbi:MAG: ATP-binding cassette domain-containing protein, partial [Snowella sp.]
DQISFTAGSGAYLLQEISFTLRAGERVAVVGASGAGKTSLLRLLNRLAEPVGGVIEFASQPLTQIAVRQLRQQVALVPQEPKLLGMAVAETLTYPLRLQHLPKAEIQQRLDIWLTRLHLPQDWLERHEWQLSLGQRQLVSIVRALAMQPQVLLLDEPTSALDAGRAAQLVEVLVDLAQKQQVAVMMVNHQLEIARQFCERVLYLRGGRLVADLPAPQVDWSEIAEDLRQVAVERSWQGEF